MKKTFQVSLIKFEQIDDYQQNLESLWILGNSETTKKAVTVRLLLFSMI